MTSPPGGGTPIVPENGYTAQTLYQLQNVDPDALGEESNLDLHAILEEFRNNLLTKLLGGFASVPIAILDGIEDVIAAITGILHGDFDDLHEWAQNVIAGFGDLLAALQGKYTGTDSFLLQVQKWAGDLFAWVQDVADFVQNLLDAILRGIRGIPVVGGAIADVISDLTGLKNKADAAKSTADDVKAGITSGYSGTAGGDQSVNAVIRDYQNRITALEGGGTLFTCATSTTLDLSMFSKFKVYMWGSSWGGLEVTGPTGADNGSGTFFRGGTFGARTFTAAQLTALGVNLSAVQVVVGAAPTVVGAAQNDSRFGNYGSSWAMETNSGASFYINADGVYQDVSALVPGGGMVVASVGAGGSGYYRNVYSSITQTATAGIGGASTALAPGGTGGAAGTTGVGGDGGNGNDADFTNRAYAGGSQGGGAGGGGLNGSTPRNGGNAGHGGWPGGAPGGRGGGAVYVNVFNSATNAPAGARGAFAPGAVLIEAS